MNTRQFCAGAGAEEAGRADSGKRSVRSFARRQGRMTRAQREALQNHWADYGIDFSQNPLDLDACFGRVGRPRIMEIGFGMGDALIAAAQAEPEKDFLGIEVYQAGVGRVLSQAHRLGLNNLRVSQMDAVEFLQTQIVPGSFDEIRLFFPDPWPKKRHHKRRIVQTDFVNLVVNALREGGHFHVATDWAPYADHILEVLNAIPVLENVSPNQGFIPRPAGRVETKFERRGKRLGHQVFDILFRRKSGVRDDG
ncbi:MAG: tRNA (guanosine(46)-N7)-methyltransferase TrmB [Gammaproteobacteria bacterium]|nr:MAG: tRNA (guanosine(46)-N7)-methyltransferase TrmB [Gammaproteobacteria bacterium]